MGKDIFDRLSSQDIFDRIKLDLFDRIGVELEDILEKKLSLSDEVKEYIRKQIEKVADAIITKNVSKIKVDSLSSKDVEGIVKKHLKEEEKEKEVEKKIESAKEEIKEEVDKVLKELKKKNAAMMNDFYSKSGNFYQFGGYALTVTEEDGAPSGIPTKLKFSNGTVTNNGDGSFSIANSSSAAPVDAKYVTLDTNATLTEERVLTGTVNQITVTDNGAGSTVVLSTPQDIATSSSPTFNALTLTTPLGIASGGTSQATAILAFNALSPLTTLGDTLYNDGTNDVRLAGNTTATKNFLVQTGNGAVSAAPSWGTILDADIPATLVRTTTTITAGAGLTGGGDLSANRTIDVGAGTGITVNADDVALTIPVVVTSGGTGQTTYTNGQLLIGNTTGNTLTKATLTGTANQVVVTNGTGSITLSTPQDIGTGSTPTFSDLTLSSLTANQLVVTGTSGAINVLGAATNGQIPIGSTGSAPVLAGITGTSNQITVTNGAGTITLSTPQDIATTSSPTFDGLLLAIVNKTTTYTITASDYVVTCDASGAAFTVTLPTAVGKTGQMFHIKKTDSSINAVTIATTSSQTVDGDTSVTINTQYESYMVISDNANWHIL